MADMTVIQDGGAVRQLRQSAADVPRGDWLLDKWDEVALTNFSADVDA